MYHAIVLEDLLDLINVGGSGDVVGEQTLAQWRAAASRMRAWLAAMSHPDGQIAFFNDAAFGIAAEPATLAAYARQLGLPPVDVPAAGVIRLDQSGYVRLSCSDAVALVDAAPIGPDYLPGHAHADTLSFELSLGAERIVVNGGTSRYGLGPERLRERGTAAHSTVELDGENSSEVWSGFRVGRRARIIDTRAWGADGVLYAEAAHDGYRHRPGRPVHRRRWALAPGQLEIADTVEGRASAAVARLHLGPGVRASAADDGLSGELITPGGRRVRWTSTSPAAVLTDVWSPEFGRQVETGMLEIAFGGSTLATSLRW
jgi:uncharacterized heparinase superfamily protein